MQGVALMNPQAPALVERNPVIAAHCIGPYMDKLDISGVEHYSDRALLLSAKCVFLHGGGEAERAYMADYHDYLQQCQIGAERKHFVDGTKSLLLGIQADPEARNLFRRLIEQGCQFESFCSYGAFTDFVNAFNLSDAQVRCPPRALVEPLDDKARLRELDQIDPDLQTGAFPAHRVVRADRSTVARTIVSMCNEHGAVYVKRPDLDGGVGQMAVWPDTTSASIAAFLDNYHTPDQPMIVEEHVAPPGVEVFKGSIQWYLNPEAGTMNRRFLSRQYEIGTEHQGNNIGKTFSEVFPSDWSNTERTIAEAAVWAAVEPFGEWALDRGYHGPLGFDFLLRQDSEEGPKVFLIEANARTSACTYLFDVQQQIAERYGLEVAVASHNVHPTNATHFMDVLERLRVPTAEDGFGDLTFDPHCGTGVLVANPRCLLKTDKPKCLLLSVAATCERAEEQLFVAKTRLETG